MFYTKYRPQKFSEISKPNDVADAISTQVKNNKIGHAYLFVGPRGTGKTTTARILAKALNCSNLDKNGDPCNECTACVDITNGSFLDLIEIDAASNRGIDDIRDLKEKIKLAPSSGKKKVYIIDEVHMLTTEAFNALLKTLEEPPSHTTFILCTTELHKVPDTIKSRCQVFKFKRASVTQLVNKLEKIAELEGAKLSSEELSQIASAAHGGFRDAETILQQVVEGEISASNLLSSGNVESISDFVELLIEKNTVGALHLVGKLYTDGIDLSVWIGELLKYLRSLLFVSVNAADGLLDVSDEILASLKKHASLMATTSGLILVYLETISEAQKATKSSFITQLPLEIAVVKLCNFNGYNGAVGSDNGNNNGNGMLTGGHSSVGGGSSLDVISKKSTNSSRNDVSTSKDTKNLSTNMEASPKVTLDSSDAIVVVDSNSSVSAESSYIELVDATLVPAAVVSAHDLPLDSGSIAESEVVIESTYTATMSSNTDLDNAGFDNAQSADEAADANSVDINIELVTQKWEGIIKEVSDLNNTTAALLKVCKLNDIQDSVLYLEVPFDFHKERMESTKNKTMIETAIKNALGSFVQINCSVKKRGKLTDHNVVVPSGSPAKKSKEELLEFFDGGLPF